MKILHAVEFYWPHVGGAQEVVRRLSEAMALRGHDVTVATTRLTERSAVVHNGVKIEGFDIRGNWTNGITGEVERYREWVRTQNFDIILMYAAQQWTTDVLLPNLASFPGKKILVPCGFSGLHVPSYREYFEKLKDWFHDLDACVILSDTYQDTQFLRKAGYSKLHLIPNGASADEFSDIQSRRGHMRSALKISNQTRLILHVGSHTGYKGHEELIDAFSRSKIRDACLLIIGNRFSRRCVWECKLASLKSRIYPTFRLARKQIVTMEVPREKILDAYADADLFAFFSNVECSPIVLFESAAAGIPFLASEAGNSAEISQWLGSGRTLPLHKRTDSEKVGIEISVAAEMLEQMLADQKTLKHLGAIGREAWQRGYSWEAIAQRYLDLYSEVSS